MRAGEIVGIAGVSGNGQSELLDVLSGLLTPDRGELQLGDHHFTPTHWLSTRQARELRLAHVPEDRHRRGLVLPFDAWESAVLGYQERACYVAAGWMRQGAMRHDTAEMMERYDVRPRNPGCAAAVLAAATSKSWCWRVKPCMNRACCWWASRHAAWT